ncbi:MAG: hypothetical protein RL133_989 [Pseudomonadota bacterium]
MSAATPSAMPTVDIREIKLMKRVDRAQRPAVMYRSPTESSKGMRGVCHTHPMRTPSSTGSIWIVDDGLISASEAEVLRQRLLNQSLSRPAQDALRGLMRAEPRRSHAPLWPGVMQSLSECLGQKPDALPWAAWSAEADGLQPEPGEHWAFLTTGHLHMTPQQVRLLPCPAPADETWQAALEAGLREGFEIPASEQQALRLRRGDSGQLYLCLQTPLAVEAMHPALLIDHHLPDVLPEGVHARAWRRASQLACMLTYDWSRDHGYPDTLWLWGTCGVRDNAKMLAAAAAPAPSPLWLAGYARAWREMRQEPEPLIHWLPLPSEPAPNQDMVACWSDHWSTCLTEIAAQGDALLIAGLKAQASAWAFVPTPAAAWQLGLGRAPGLHDLAQLLATTESE